MGQHKSNPNVELARQGLLPPKEKKLSKKQQERLLQRAIYEKMMAEIPAFGALANYMPQ